MLETVCGDIPRDGRYGCIEFVPLNALNIHFENTLCIPIFEGVSYPTDKDSNPFQVGLA